MSNLRKNLDSIYNVATNRLFLIGAIVVLIFLSLRQCEKANGLEEEEIGRAHV